MIASSYIFLMTVPVYGVIIYILILLVKALCKYIKSPDIRKEEAVIKKSLGGTIKELRTERKMTQEFVAESLGVSRQAVSKWESGTSDPSTSNLFALAKLFGISAEELLRRVNMEHKQSKE